MLCSNLNSQTQHRFLHLILNVDGVALLHRHKTACQIRSRSHAEEPTSAISHTCGRIQVLSEPRPYFSWSECFTSKVFLSDLWWCSRISAQPAPVTTKVMVIPLRAGEREEERDSYFTAHCVRHTPYGCFEACAQARSPDWGLVAGLQRIKADCAVEEFHLWALVEAQCRLSLSSFRTMRNQRFIEVGSACIFSPILAEFFDTAELFLLQLSRVTSWRNLRVLSNFETSQDSNSNFSNYSNFLWNNSNVADFCVPVFFHVCCQTPLQIRRSRRFKASNWRGASFLNSWKITWQALRALVVLMKL